MKMNNYSTGPRNDVIYEVTVRKPTKRIVHTYIIILGDVMKHNILVPFFILCPRRDERNLIIPTKPCADGAWHRS